MSYALLLEILLLAVEKLSWKCTLFRLLKKQFFHRALKVMKKKPEKDAKKEEKKEKEKDKTKSDSSKEEEKRGKKEKKKELEDTKKEKSVCQLTCLH